MDCFLALRHRFEGMDQSPLHAVKKSAIKKTKRPTKPSLSKEELAALKQSNEWKDRIRMLQQVKRYQEKGEEQELKSLICHWRQVAQDVACKLACHFSMDEPFIEASLWNQNQLQDTLPDSDGANTEEDPMGRMLSLLHIDHDLLRYSSKTGDFYN
ncbi:hypothetical protein BX666DRAFT_2021850 [Dichotomocladium elegans]|nr:hypothetical protein BX666DRAFT_2021850 [Dichotomocladium elegans]